MSTLETIMAACSPYSHRMGVHVRPLRVVRFLILIARSGVLCLRVVVLVVVVVRL